MSTQAFAGFGGHVTWAGTSMVEVKNWKASYNQETADVTSLSSSGYRDRLATLADLTGSIETNVFLSTSMGHARALVLYAGVSSSTSKPSLSCRAFFKLSLDVPPDAVNFTYDFESTGPISIATS